MKASDSPMREIALSEITARLRDWLWGHGGPTATITVAPAHANPDIEIANIVDSLSAYIHGQFLEEYSRRRMPWDFEGHPVVTDL